MSNFEIFFFSSKAWNINTLASNQKPSLPPKKTCVRFFVWSSKDLICNSRLEKHKGSQCYKLYYCLAKWLLALKTTFSILPVRTVVCTNTRLHGEHIYYQRKWKIEHIIYKNSVTVPPLKWHWNKCLLVLRISIECTDQMFRVIEIYNVWFDLTWHASIKKKYIYIHVVSLLGKFESSYQGKATAAARAALPSPTSACWVFSCVRTPPNSDMDYIQDHWRA